jgi:hypothetical protein
MVFQILVFGDCYENVFHLKEYKQGVELLWRFVSRHPALPVEVTLNHNYPRYNSMSFATLWQFKTLYMSSE